MEIEESKWIDQALDNMERYLNRGGDSKGDEPQCIGGTDFLNTIGVAMGLPVRDPQKWSQYELEKALKNELVYFEGDARKAIDVIANQIRKCCSGDDKNFITVLPIEFYWEGKLHELPLFRVQRYKNSPKYYVDHTGRSYDSVSDWYDNNKLPPCKMLYPKDLILARKPGCDYPIAYKRDTPAARPGTKFFKGVDITTSLVGFGSGVGLMFASGGLATPFVVAGVATSIWGTCRTGGQIIDKATHGESINPFKSWENRLLWLGIAANIASFGAMGASMRIAFLASRGRDISNSFKVLVNVVNGTNLVVSSIVMVDSTVFLIEHYDQMSSMDKLMHLASLAFWTKGVFTYKTANTLIKNAQDHTFNVISKELPPDDAKKMSTFRTQYNNDAQLLKAIHKASESNISIQTFSQIVIDSASLHENIKFDGSGNMILAGGQKYSLEVLSKLPQNIRREYFDIINNFNKDQMELFESFRNKVNNDMNLISGLNKVAAHYHLSTREATDVVLNFYGKYIKMNKASGPKIYINQNKLVVGRAPPLQINQLRDLSNPMVRFIGDHLAHMDEKTSHQWTSSVPLLLQLENQGMFSNCKVTRIVPTGRAVVLLNDNIEISIYKLKELSSDSAKLLKLIGKLPANAPKKAIADDDLAFIEKHRLRLQYHRQETVTWVKENINVCLFENVLKNVSDLKSYEKDRLFTLKGTITTRKAIPYIRPMMSFVSTLNPRNVSEMVAYCEYVVNYIETEKVKLQNEFVNGQIQLPPKTKKAEYLRQKASEAVFRNESALRSEWNSTLALVRQNSMAGPATIEAGLSNDALVTAVQRTRVGFGSETSAAYHILKHPTDPISAYVQRANETIRTATVWTVTLTQEGDARSIRYEGPGGAAIVLEREGSVVLCTFTPKTSKSK